MISKYKLKVDLHAKSTDAGDRNNNPFSHS